MLTNYEVGNIKKYMLGQIGTLAWPVVAEMTCLVIGGVLTTAMVGSFGAVEVASVGLAMLLQATAAMVIAAFGVGSGALCARSIGARDFEGARYISGQTISIGVVLSLVAAFLGVKGGRFLVSLASPDEQVISMAGDFIEIMAFFLPVMAVTNICLAGVRSTGKTRIAMMVAVLGLCLSLSVTYAALFYFKTGVRGAVFGIASSQSLAAVLSFMAVRSPWILGVRMKHIFPWRPAVMLNILRISIPAAFEQFAIQSGRLCFSLLMASAGAVQFAGHNVALQIESISFMPGMAFGIAAMTLVGQNLGRGLPHRAKQYAWFTCFIGATVMGFLGVLFYVFSEQLTAFFIKDPAVLEWGRGCVRVAAIEQVALALGMILPGVLRGAGDTVSPMYVAIFGSWLFRIPILLFIKHMGIFTVVVGWSVACIDFVIRAILFIYIVRRKDWSALSYERR